MSWTLNAWIVRYMFPRLIPGQSAVIQEDHIYYLGYWIFVTIRYCAEHFDYIDTLSESSRYNLCAAWISDERARVDLEALFFDEKESLLLGAISRCRPNV